MKFVLIMALVLIPASGISGQSGGTFSITQSVVANGGGQNSAGGIFAVDGTVAQPNIGATPSGGTISIRSGFWLPALAPTAANVSIGGRILTANGIGIRNATIVLTSQNGVTRSTVSSSFGYYRFDDIAAGETYILTVSAKHSVFQQASRVVSVNEQLNDLDFVAFIE